MFKGKGVEGLGFLIDRVLKSYGVQGIGCLRVRMLMVRVF